MRRPSPTRIYEAKRARVRARMVLSWHVPEADADRLLDGWDAEAAGRGIARTEARDFGEVDAWLRAVAGVSTEG